MSLDLEARALTRKAVLSFYEALDCPRSLMCAMLYTYGEHDQLVSLAFDPICYNSIGDARDALAATKLLSKAQFLETSFDLKAVALATFVDCERQVQDVNLRLQSVNAIRPVTHSVLLTAARFIDGVLGDFHPDEFADACNWGPGASVAIKRRDATSPKKFAFERQITPIARNFVESWFREAYPTWSNTFDGFVDQPASKVVTVPKNSKTDRTIAIEPGLNLWFQKGIGSMLRKRLKRVGIDLNDQGHNQRLARLGSKFNELATIDFSAASDTISRSIVRELLPSRWHLILDIFRSRSYTLEGELRSFNKFSSMGNGFTFELESLIFYSLGYALCVIKGVDTSNISVYGDDVILPTSVVDDYTAVCADVGFKVNTSKSYSSTYYRESCGEHFWNGVSIKPIFLKESLDGKDQVLKFANSVRRLSHRYGNTSCDIRFRPLWQLLRRSLGTNVPTISDGFGDLALVCNIDECHKPPQRAKHGYEGFHVHVWGLVPRTLLMEHEGVLLSKLRRMGKNSFNDKAVIAADLDRCEGNKIPLPCKTKVAKFRILVPRWADLGPWL